VASLRILVVRHFVLLLKWGTKRLIDKLFNFIAVKMSKSFSLFYIYLLSGHFRLLCPGFLQTVQVCGFFSSPFFSSLVFSSPVSHVLTGTTAGGGGGGSVPI
jgi:hypothetical protein